MSDTALMTTVGPEQAPAGTPSTEATPGRYTVVQLGRRVGMSPRNIRAHQARRLLPPPTRTGRVAYYDEVHVRRLEAIKSLQRQGFNLVSIEAMLGVRRAEAPADPVRALVARVAAERPGLVYALSRHGVLGRGEDGGIRPVRGRALRAACDLRRAGVSPTAALQLLAEVLDNVRLMTQELVQLSSTRILALAPQLAETRGRTFQELDQDTMQLAQGLLTLLSEAFRVSVENNGDATVADLLARRADLDGQLRSTTAIDAG